MIGKGAVYKSFKEVPAPGWVWMNHPGERFGEITQKLVRVVRKNGSRPVVKMDSGAEIEVRNPRALTKVIGDPG